ncbi:DUF4407 domain-containing protein [Tsukamurella paurometabola]|uniref:DUF4407 domain-containing protein n=1 Tax=Tsukamurella paurometabola TaxID=2061 RepID=A0ABS5NDA3_TSUPA|nr:DUF4407 domain-containing protein [Tsukamurella paurometabola]MBS4102240.1 DUF4407 domain-containing protein [Tsukamurella paurometabola]
MIPALAVLAFLVGAAVCVTVAAPGRRAALPSRFLVCVVVGLVVGELVSMLALNGAIEDRLRTDADRAAVAAPEVRAAQAELDAARADRAALDAAVAEASGRRDQALVVARCEYRPGPACPQTSITGVPGRGPESRSANERLASAQADLDRATAARAKDAPGRDARIASARTEVAAARTTAARVDDGVDVRWIALNGVTAQSLSAAALRIGIDLVSILIALLPLLLRLWRGETARDIRHRRDLESERLASAARLAIERREHERRVELALADDPPTEMLPAHGAAAGAAALEAAGFEPVAVTARRYRQEIPAVHDDFLPIAAAAEAASLRAPGQPPADETPTGPLPVVGATDETPEPEEPAVSDENTLPARVAEAAPAVPARAAEHKPNPFVPPVIDGAARTIAGFVRPLMPPIVARVLPGGATRTVQQSYEEVEEVTFAMRRTRKVVVGTVEQSVPAPSGDAVQRDATAPAAEEPLDVAHESIDALPGQGARELGQPGQLRRSQ